MDIEIQIVLVIFVIALIILLIIVFSNNKEHVENIEKTNNDKIKIYYLFDRTNPENSDYRFVNNDFFDQFIKGAIINDEMYLDIVKARIQRYDIFAILKSDYDKLFSDKYEYMLSLIQSNEENYTILNNCHERHLQILNESYKIIKETNNINTLLSRKIDIDNELDYFIVFYRNESNKLLYNINFDPNTTKEELGDTINNMILRIANNNFNLMSQKISELIRKDAKERQCIKMFETIDFMRENIDMTASNKDKILLELNEIHYKIEESYSQINIKS